MSGFIYTNSGGPIAQTVAKQFPLFDKGSPVYFWADKGLVRFADEREGSRKPLGFMYWHEARERVLAVSDLVMRSSEDPSWAHERRKLQQFICEMEDVIRIAKEQGGPFDGDQVRRDYNRRRPTSVIVPQEVTLD